MEGLTAELWRVAIALAAVALAIRFTVSTVGPALPFLVVFTVIVGLSRLAWARRNTHW